MEPALPVGWAFFPLDEELGLVSGGLTPRGEETLVRRARWMPFEQARELLQEVLGIQVSKATARRATLQTGEAALAVCEGEVERLKQEVPQAPAGADKQAMSGDGAFVHLVGGEWVEVKTLTIGEVTRTKRGEVCMQQISSFSRLAEAERFAEAAVFVNDIGGQFLIRIGARDSFECVTDNQIWGPCDNEKGNHLASC